MKRHAISAIALFAVTSFLPAAARADEPAAARTTERAPTDPGAVRAAAPTAPVEASTEEAPREGKGGRWYGWQTLAVDGASMTLLLTGALVAGSSTRNEGMLGARVLVGGSLLGFALGAPVVHVVNGEPGRAAGSLGLRVGLPAVGFMIGLAAAPSCSSSTGEYGPCLKVLDTAAAGAGLGMLAASMLDAWLLAHTSAPDRVAPRAAMLRVAPQIDPARASYGLTLVASGF